MFVWLIYFIQFIVHIFTYWIFRYIVVARPCALAQLVTVRTLLKIVSRSVGFCSYCVLKITRSVLKITRSVLKITRSRDQDSETFFSSFLSSSNWAVLQPQGTTTFLIDFAFKNTLIKANFRFFSKRSELQRASRVSRSVGDRVQLC